MIKKKKIYGAIHDIFRLFALSICTLLIKLELFEKKNFKSLQKCNRAQSNSAS